MSIVTADRVGLPLFGAIEEYTNRCLRGSITVGADKCTIVTDEYFAENQAGNAAPESTVRHYKLFEFDPEDAAQ